MSKGIQKLALTGAVFFALYASVEATHAAAVYDFQEVGGNVVGTLSGSLDLTNAVLGFNCGVGCGQSSSFNSQFASLQANPSTDGYNGNAWRATGTSSWGTGGTVQGATVGNPIEVKGGAFPIVFLPISFGGGQLSATFTIISSTFASLGVTPGSYVYTLLGSNDTMTVQFGVNPIPIPAALPLFATGVATVAYAGRRRKKAGAAQAAA